MSLAKSFFWLAFAEILFNLSGYAVHSGAGRLLTPEDYGRYSLIVTLTIMVITLIGNGIPIAMSKYLSEYCESRPELVPKIKKIGLILQLILIGAISIVFYILTPLLSFLLKDSTLTPLFRISIFILPMYAIDSLYFYYYTGIQQFGFQSFLKILRSILRITIIIGFIYLWKVEGAIAGYIFVPFVVFLAALLADAFKFSKKFPQKSSSNFDWKKLLNYAWPITLFMIFYELLISLDLYFIKSITQEDYLTGIYNSALMLARIPYYLFYALTIILLPSVSNYTAQNDYKKASEIISQSLRFMLIILVPVVTLLAIYAAPSINFVFGAEYLEGANSLQILSFGVGFLSIFYVLSFALNGAGLAKIPMWIAFLGMILNAALNYFFIHLYGIIGSAIATSISSFLVMLSSIIYSRRYFEKIIHLGETIKIISGGVIIYFLSLFFPPHKFLFILWGIILTVVYTLFLYIIKVIKKDDLQKLLGIIRKKKV